MLEALGDEVVEVDVEGTAGWMLREHAEEAAAEDPPERLVRLLPGFDMWVIGAARDAAALLDPAEKKRVYRNQGWISPVLLVNGRMDGVWKHERKGKRLVGDDRAVREAAEVGAQGGRGRSGAPGEVPGRRARWLGGLAGAASGRLPSGARLGAHLRLHLGRPLPGALQRRSHELAEQRLRPQRA